MKRDLVKSMLALKKPCKPVKSEEELVKILTDLEESLNIKDGYGLAANQIGYDKQVAIIRMRGSNDEDLKIDLINPVIINKSEKFIFRNESCLSFPGMRVDTFRWKIILIESGLDRRDTYTLTGLEAVVAQHEITHLKGRTMFDCKYKKRG